MNSTTTLQASEARSTSETSTSVESRLPKSEENAGDSSDALTHRQPTAAQTKSAPIRPLPRSFAWLQVVGVFFVYFNTWGLILAFGDLQTFYQNDLLRSESSSTLSWIATIASFLLLFGGFLTGPLYDRGYFPHMIVGGSVLVVLGCMMLSLSAQYYQVFLSQGVCIGLGSTLMWVPSLANLAASFTPAERSLPMGVAAAGSSVGGVIFPIMFRRLQPHIGFPWTLRTFGFIILFTSAISLASILPRRPPRSPVRRGFWDASAFKDLPYIAQVLSGFFTLIGYFIPLVFLPQFAQTAVRGLGNAGDAFYLLAIVNGASAFGRIGAGWLTSKLGVMDTYVGALVVSTVLLFAWISVETYAGLIVWSVFWGMITGVIISMPGSIIPLLSPSLKVVGTRIGMAWVPSAVGMLVGSPIGGALIVHKDQQFVWWHLQVFAGLSMFVSIGFCVVPWYHLGLRRRA